MSTSAPSEESQSSTSTEPTITAAEILAIINPIPPSGIDEKTYTGSCHCRLVTYSVSLPSTPSGFSFSLSRCNCSICHKKGYLNIYVRDTSTFKVLNPSEDTTSDVLGDYTFGAGAMHHRFCKNCGTNLFVKGVVPKITEEWVMVNAYTLDEVDFSKMKPERYWDGKGERWLQPLKEPEAPGMW